MTVVIALIDGSNYAEYNSIKDNVHSKLRN